MEKKEKTPKAAHPLYATWVMMRQRCNNPNATSAPWYHDMGIRVCEEWENDFWAFVRDMGEKPSPKHTLDRINSNGNYEPSNCRWANRTLQSLNRRPRMGLKHNKPRGIRPWIKPVEYQGKMWTIKQLAEEFGMSETTLRARLGCGYTVDEARHVPKHKTRRKWNETQKGGESSPPL